MNARTVDAITNNSIRTLQMRLQRLSMDYPVLSNIALLLIHGVGCLLMTSPLLVLVASFGGTVYLSNNLQGPLDWFLIEVQASLSVLSAYLSMQLFALRPAQPAGATVTQQQAPELCDMLARRIAHFKIGPIGQILLTTNAELRVVASPVLPLPLFHRYSLCVGAPIMFFLNQDQFRLALAGAVAASAENRSRLSGWLCQACRDWPLILGALEHNDNLLSRLFSRPLRHLTAAANLLGQHLDTDWRVQQGYWVLQNSDENTATNYLANQVVAATFLERQYWPMILKAAERCPTPVVKAFSHLPLLLGKTLNRQVVDRWLMEAQTPSDRNHSGVRDLLAELKLDHLRWSGLPTPNVFCIMFRSTSVLKQLDQLWQHDIEPEWRRRHAHFQTDRARFEQLHKRATAGELRGESAVRYITLTPRFVEEADALPVYRGVYATNRDDGKVCFAAGLALLRAGAGQEGSQALLRAAELDPSLARRAHALIDQNKQEWVHEESVTGEAVVREICA
jgi:hypothetical protein